MIRQKCFRYSHQKEIKNKLFTTLIWLNIMQTLQMILLLICPSQTNQRYEANKTTTVYYTNNKVLNQAISL